MTDLKELRLETFEPQVGEEFIIQLVDENQALIDFPLKLVTVQAIGVKERDEAAYGRASFSLIFEHERKDVYLNQGVYAVQNKQLGVFDLFLVPMGPVENGMQYEVIFT